MNSDSQFNEARPLLLSGFWLYVEDDNRGDISSQQQNQIHIRVIRSLAAMLANQPWTDESLSNRY